MPRKMAIILSILIFLALAAYFDVYDYLRFNTFVKKIDDELFRMAELDKNITAKREYIDTLEKIIQPRMRLDEIKELARTVNLDFSIEKDGTYVLQGETSSEVFSRVLVAILNSANLNIKSMNVTNNLRVPVDIPGITNEGSVRFKIVLTGVMVE
ncbi:hypothetical protein ACSFC1_00665 [Pseudothermotoga sp. U03pept]|uniref:hypothetical protein n=1 Tax=Pseudothermotoga sp. U03pept TaxID=3447012 RepID=UPI003F0A6A35